MKLFIFCFSIFIFSNLGLSQTNQQLDFRLICLFDTKMAGSKLPMKLELENKSSDSLKIIFPDVSRKSVIINLYKNSVKLNQAVRWLSSSPGEVIISPGQCISRNFDLRDFYSYFISSGEYSCQLSYKYSNDSMINSEVVNFELLPLSSFENESRQEVKKIMHFHEDKYIEMGEEYLKKFDKSIFSIWVKKKLAHTLQYSNKVDESIIYYKEIYTSNKSTKIEKRQAILSAAYAWLEKGNREKSIETLKLDPSLSFKYKNPNWGIDWKFGSLESKLKSRNDLLNNQKKKN